MQNDEYIANDLDVKAFLLNPNLHVDIDLDALHALSKGNATRFKRYSEVPQCTAEKELFLKTGKITDLLEICTLDEFDLTPKFENPGQTHCACLPYDQCEWSKKVFNKMLKLGSRSPLQLGYSRLDHFIISSVGRSFFQKRICSKNKTKMFIAVTKIPALSTIFQLWDS